MVTKTVAGPYTVICHAGKNKLLVPWQGVSVGCFIHIRPSLTPIFLPPIGEEHQSIDKPSNPISIHRVNANPCPGLNWIDTDWPCIAEDNPVLERGTSLLQGPTVGFSGA